MTMSGLPEHAITSEVPCGSALLPRGHFQGAICCFAGSETFLTARPRAYKVTVDLKYCIVFTIQRHRERRPTRKISRLRVNEGANWVGRNAIARRSASLKSPVGWDPFERPISSLRLRSDE